MVVQRRSLFTFFDDSNNLPYTPVMWGMREDRNSLKFTDKKKLEISFQDLSVIVVGASC